VACHWRRAFSTSQSMSEFTSRSIS